MSAPFIEKIFELPLASFEKFSIFECAKEEFFKTIIHDKFIWNQLAKHKHTKLGNLIEEMIEGDDPNNKAMTNKIEYFKNYYLDLVRIAEIGSSIDERCPEDAKPVGIQYKLKEYYENEGDNNICYNKFETDGEEPYIDIDDKNYKDKENNNYGSINMIRFNGKNITNTEEITSNSINEIKKLTDINHHNINKLLITKDDLENNIINNKQNNIYSNLNKNMSDISDTNININSINSISSLNNISSISSISHISSIGIERQNKVKNRFFKIQNKF